MTWHTQSAPRDRSRRRRAAAPLPRVRAALVARQRKLGEGGRVVMEGRDVGTVIFPRADVKVFLDASPDERARRRASVSPSSLRRKVGAHPPATSPASGSAAPVVVCARLRSASARLQRLDEPTGDRPSVLRRAEYLTAVSGGSYMASALAIAEWSGTWPEYDARGLHPPGVQRRPAGGRRTGCPRSRRARRRRAGSGATRPTSPATPAR